MSSIAALASASTPSGRLSMRRSTRIRASTGNAVIDIETPMNSANAGEAAVRADQRRRSAAPPRARRSSGSPRRCWRSRRSGEMRPLSWREVDLEPDEEHVEDQPEVGRDADERDDVRAGRRAAAARAGSRRRTSGRAGSPPAPRPSRAAGRSCTASVPIRRANEHHDRDGDEEGGQRCAELALLLGATFSVAARPRAPAAGERQRDVAVGGGAGELGLVAVRAGGGAR